MADLSITAANVLPGENTSSKASHAGEAVTAGKVIFLNSTTKKWALADSNSVTPEAREATAIALNGAALNQPLVGHTKGPITVGATLVPGTSYYLSDTQGGICTLEDVGSGEYVCLLGIATSTAVLDFDPKFPNVAL